MKYRAFGNTEFDVSALGFGCMRFPVDEDKKTVNTDEAIKMIRYAIDNGVNYFDSAHGYHDGTSEVVLGKALKDGYRQKVKIATKLPVWDVKSPDDFDRLLAEQLERLGVDYIDYYLFHGLGRGSYDTLKDNNLFDKMDTAMGDGRIKGAAFSFHDDYDCFVELLNMYSNWSMAQIQFNYIDKNNQAGEKGVKYAADKGIAIAAMVPCLGGRLANLPPDAEKALTGSDKERSLVQWAYDWVWNYPGVSTVLSGMSAMQQVIDNVNYACDSQINSMTTGDLKRIDNAVEEINKIPQIPCTLCKYCMPCPQNVNIPACLTAMNEGRKYGPDAAMSIYNWWMDESEHADKCNSCGTCEPKCPQKINISNEIPKVAEYITTLI